MLKFFSAKISCIFTERLSLSLYYYKHKDTKFFFYVKYLLRVFVFTVKLFK
jgi:hypothetical protein